MMTDSSSNKCLPSCGLTTGFLIQSIRTREGRDQAMFVSPIVFREGVMHEFHTFSLCFMTK